MSADFEVVVVGNEEGPGIGVIGSDIDAVEPGAREAGDGEPGARLLNGAGDLPAERLGAFCGVDLDVDAFEVLEKEDGRDGEVDEPVGELVALIGSEVCP